VTPAPTSAGPQSALLGTRGGRESLRAPAGVAGLRRLAALALVAMAWLPLAGATARAAVTRHEACRLPIGARLVASAAGARVWRQSTPTPPWARPQYNARASYPRYSGCLAGHQPRVLFRDYAGDDVVVRIAGDYVGLLDRGGMVSLYLSNLLTGRTTSTRSFTSSLWDLGGSEANEPGPLLSWKVVPSGWLVYLDGLSDFEGFGTALVAFGESGGTTLDLAALAPSPGSAIGDLVVRGKTVSWRSSFSGTHRVRLGRALLPARLPKPLPTACRLVPRSLARRLLGPLAARSPAPRLRLADFSPRARTGTDRSGCAYAAAADPRQTIAVAEQRVTPAIVSQQQRAINNTPRADDALVLPGIAAVLFRSRATFSPPPGPEDLRLFIHGVEVDLMTANSPRAAGEIEAAGLAIERALHDAPPARTHT
jgi:hypothetical protein